MMCSLVQLWGVTAAFRGEWPLTDFLLGPASCGDPRQPTPNRSTKSRTVPARTNARPATSGPSEYSYVLASLGFVASGALHHRAKVCGEPTCKCASDPNVRRGRCCEWGRMRLRRLVQSTITPAQAKLLERGIVHRQRVKGLLAEWERLDGAEIRKPEIVRDALTFNACANQFTADRPREVWNVGRGSRSTPVQLIRGRYPPNWVGSSLGPKQ
jgi:hypothetical protein